MRYVLALVRRGVPYDVAFSLDEAELLAYNVVFGEIERNKSFNWTAMDWPSD